MQTCEQQFKSAAKGIHRALRAELTFRLVTLITKGKAAPWRRGFRLTTQIGARVQGSELNLRHGVMVP